MCFLLELNLQPVSHNIYDQSRFDPNPPTSVWSKPRHSDGETSFSLIIHWASLFIHPRGTFRYLIANCKLWLGKSTTPQNPRPDNYLLLTGRAAWLSEADVTARTYPRSQSCYTPSQTSQWGRYVSTKCETLTLISQPPCFLTNSHSTSIFSSSISNHPILLPSAFQSGVALKPYAIYTHSDSIMFRSI